MYFIGVFGAACGTCSAAKFAVLAGFSFVSYPKINVFLIACVDSEKTDYLNPGFAAVGASESLFETAFKFVLDLI
jgi:hypothetical protein